MLFVKIQQRNVGRITVTVTHIHNGKTTKVHYSAPKSPLRLHLWNLSTSILRCLMSPVPCCLENNAFTVCVCVWSLSPMLQSQESVCCNTIARRLPPGISLCFHPRYHISNDFIIDSGLCVYSIVLVSKIPRMHQFSAKVSIDCRPRKSENMSVTAHAQWCTHTKNSSTTFTPSS